MTQLIRLDEDWHVNCTFPDDTNALRETVHAAEGRKLKKIVLVAKAGRFSEWVGEFVRACRALDRRSRVEVCSGLEAEVLDTHGTLDLSPFTSPVDHVYAGLRRLPTPDGPMDLDEASEQIASGELLPSRAIEWVVRASALAARRKGTVVLAQPLRILTELGIEARGIHPAYVRCLAGALAERWASIELCERRRCPSARVLKPFLLAGVPVRVASGSDSPDGVGRYEWCRQVAAELAGVGPRRERPAPIFIP